VRDAIRGVYESKDIDIEVYGIASMDALERVLSAYGAVNAVGKSYGVLKMRLEAWELDIALPRVETKTAQGHKGFAVTVDASLDFATAARRRDFGMNAIGYDPKAQQFLDPFGGIDAIARGEIAHIDDVTFVEDPLRVLRAVGFAARFGYTIAPATLMLCRSMVAQGMLEELPIERIEGEYKKILLLSPKPSIAFGYLDAMSALPIELAQLKNTPQHPLYHPEGDVYVHTMMAIDAFVPLRCGDARKDFALALAVLCHDMGKATTTRLIDGVLRAKGHENEVQFAIAFLARLTHDKALIEEVLTLVRLHGRPSQLYAQHASDGAVRRLATQVVIEDLVTVAKADFFGRTTPAALSGRYEAGEWLLERASHLGVRHEGVAPYLKGRHLLAHGMQAGAHFAPILAQAYEAQLEGEIVDEESAIVWLEVYLEREKMSNEGEKILTKG